MLCRLLCGAHRRPPIGIWSSKDAALRAIKWQRCDPQNASKTSPARLPDLSCNGLPVRAAMPKAPHSSVGASHTTSTAKVIILIYLQKPYNAPARPRKFCGQDKPIFTCGLDNCQWSSGDQSTVSRHKWTHLPRSMHPRCDAYNQHGDRCGRR